MKRLVLIAGLTVLALALNNCGQKAEETATPEATTTETAPATTDMSTTDTTTMPADSAMTTPDSM